MHLCVLTTVATNALLLKHRTISSQGADLMLTVYLRFYKVLL